MREGGREREGGRGREEWERKGRRDRERENRQKRSTHPFEEASISITYFGAKSKPHTKSQNCCAKSLTPFQIFYAEFLPQTKKWRLNYLYLYYMAVFRLSIHFCLRGGLV
jgi:hypothetical protein